MGSKHRVLAIVVGLMSVWSTVFCYQTVITNLSWLGRAQYYHVSSRTSLAVMGFVLLELLCFYALTAWNAVKCDLLNRRTRWVLGPVGVLLWLLVICGCRQVTQDVRNINLLQRAQTGRTQAVRRLLAQGADREARNVSGMTPLMRAAEYGQTETVRLLLARGANIAAQDDLGMTAVTVAADQGQAATLDFLLRKGADANAADSDGRTPLLWAAAFANHQTVQMLLAHGAHVNTQSKLGKTALMMAAGDTEELGARGNAASVRVLLAAGADVTLKDHHGDTAQTLAAKRGGNDVKDIINLLTTNPVMPLGRPIVDDPNEEKSTANWP